MKQFKKYFFRACSEYCFIFYYLLHYALTRLYLYTNLATWELRNAFLFFRIIEYPCFDCDLKSNLSSPEQLIDHLERCHKQDEEPLRAMMVRKKKMRGLGIRENEGDAVIDDESLLPPLARVCGVKNESGNDCFCIAGLHLLAQTDVFNRLTVQDHHSNCPAPSCLLAHFLYSYHSSKKRVISDRPLVDNYDKVSR